LILAINSAKSCVFSRVIWLGDLNYRIALSYRSAKALVEMRDWRALLEKDQVVPPFKDQRIYIYMKDKKFLSKCHFCFCCCYSYG